MPEIVQPEKEREGHSFTADSTPDIQREDQMLPNSNSTNHAIPKNPSEAILNFMPEKQSDELFEERI